MLNNERPKLSCGFYCPCAGKKRASQIHCDLFKQVSFFPQEKNGLALSENKVKLFSSYFITPQGCHS